MSARTMGKRILACACAALRALRTLLSHITAARRELWAGVRLRLRLDEKTAAD